MEQTVLILHPAVQGKRRRVNIRVDGAAAIVLASKSWKKYRIKSLNPASEILACFTYLIFDVMRGI